MIDRRLHRIVAWLAFAATVFSALAPTLVHAQRARAATVVPWAEICTSIGLKRIAIPGDPSDPSAPSSPDAGIDCPLCQLHGAAGPLPAVLDLVLVESVCRVPSLPSAAATLPPSCWPAHRTRGPPPLS